MQMDSGIDLLKKIKGVIAVNNDIIAEIESVCDEDNPVAIIVDVIHSFDLKIDSTITFDTKSIKKVAADLVYAWENSDNDPFQFDNLFGHKFKKKVCNYYQLKQTNQSLMELSTKYHHLKNLDHWVQQLRIILTNLERIQVALGEIHRLTIPVPNPEPDVGRLIESAGLITQAFNCLGVDCAYSKFAISSRFSRASKRKRPVSALEKYQIVEKSTETIKLMCINHFIVEDRCETPGKLKTLSIHSSPGLYLPTSIARLVKLTKLSLHSNSLSRLPSVIQNLNNLRCLSFEENQISEIPDWIAELTKLEKINAKHNKLRELPDSIWELRNLKKLKLDCNKLQSVSNHISSLVDLEYLGLSSNKLTKLPDSIFEDDKLPKLLDIDITDNQFTEQPDLIGVTIARRVSSGRERRDEPWD